jgi:hypothetical protein
MIQGLIKIAAYKLDEISIKELYQSSFYKSNYDYILY